jgi:hypothetical protein
MTCSGIHSPSPGDQVDSGIGLSYRPASLCSLAGRYDNQPYAGADNILKSGTMNLASGLVATWAFTVRRSNHSAGSHPRVFSRKSVFFYISRYQAKLAIFETKLRDAKMCFPFQDCGIVLIFAE